MLERLPTAGRRLLGSNWRPWWRRFPRSRGGLWSIRCVVSMFIHVWIMWLYADPKKHCAHVIFRQMWWGLYIPVCVGGWVSGRVVLWGVCLFLLHGNTWMGGFLVEMCVIKFGFGFNFCIISVASYSKKLTRIIFQMQKLESTDPSQGRMLLLSLQSVPVWIKADISNSDNSTSFGGFLCLSLNDSRRN